MKTTAITLLSAFLQLCASQLYAQTTPEIILLTPKATHNKISEAEVDAQNKIFVSGSAKAKSGIKWVNINGVPVQLLKEDGYFSSLVDGAANQLIISAEDKMGNIEPAKIYKIEKVTKPEVAVSISPVLSGVPPVYHAILIACSNYSGAGGWAPLPSTIKETKSLKKVLQSKYGFEEKNIIELYDKNREEITTVLSSKLERMNTNDNLVILFAGHSTSEKKADKLVGYWVPINATGPYKGYISNSELESIIAGSRARHILIISDEMLNSGSVGTSTSVKEDEVLVPMKEEYRFESRRSLSTNGLTKDQGAFILIKAVTSALDDNTDALLSEFTLYAEIFPAIKRSTGHSPVLASFGKDGNNGGQFYFKRSAVEGK